MKFSKCFKIESWDDSMAHFIFPPSLRDYDYSLLAVQCSKQLFLILSSFLVVYGRRENPLLISSSWPEAKVETLNSLLNRSIALWCNIYINSKTQYKISMTFNGHGYYCSFSVLIGLLEWKAWDTDSADSFTLRPSKQWNQKNGTHKHMRSLGILTSFYTETVSNEQKLQEYKEHLFIRISFYAVWPITTNLAG